MSIKKINPANPYDSGDPYNPNSFVDTEANFPGLFDLRTVININMICASGSMPDPATHSGVPVFVIDALPNQNVQYSDGSTWQVFSLQ